MSELTQISILKRVSEQSKITPALRRVVNSTITSLQQGNRELASVQTSVKSLITGAMLKPYGEDDDYNRKILGDSVYYLLDVMHHELAFSLGELPSGTMVFTANGVSQRGLSIIKHPEVIKINAEFKRIRESVRN